MVTLNTAGPAILSHCIAGRFQPSQGSEYLDDRDPATGAVIAKIPRGGAADVDAAVRAARAALAGPWSLLTPRQRAELLERIADGIALRAEDWALLESRDTGKPLALARSMDLPRAVENFRFFAGALLHDATDFHAMGDAFNYTLRRPAGVAALITPWNLPLYLLTWKLAPALAMGNAVVAKPSELTPLTAQALAELLQEIGLPPGVFNLVHGLGSEAGHALVAHPGVDLVSFTGGTATGAVVAAAAAPQFKKLSLELGGKNPTIIFDDAHLDQAIAEAARAAWTNGGQICLCGSRVLAQAGVYARVREGLLERMRTLRLGPPLDADTELGSLISCAHRDKVESYLRLAGQEGGSVHGGERPALGRPYDQGAFLAPALIEGLSAQSRCAREEIFGPVLSLHPFRDESEALALANGVPYGLSASLWTRDLSRAHRVAARLETGMVWVNTWLKRDLRAPFGGVKASGLGREGGVHSLEFYSESLNVCVEVAPS